MWYYCVGDIMNKVYGIEKASLLKRFSAYLLDIILTLIVATGVMALVSVITRYDDYNSQMEELYTRYEEEYDIKFDMSLEEYEKLSLSRRLYISRAIRKWEVGRNHGS